MSILSVILGVIAGIITVIIIFIFSFFGLTRIKGSSMFPTLKEDDVLLLRRILPWETPKKGEIYTFRREGKQFIKRLKYFEMKVVSSDIYYECFFVGDNLDFSYDSRNFGVVYWANVGYKAIYNFNGRSLNG